MQRARDYGRNVRMLTYFAPFRSLSISAAYLTPFFLQKGLSLTEIFLLQSVFSAAVVAFEIPSGWFADKFGRALSIKLSVPLAAVAMIAYGLSDHIALFVLWEVMLALASGLYSGVDQALLHDSLQAEGYRGSKLEQKQAESAQHIDAYGYAATGIGVPIAWTLYTYVGVGATLIADGLLTLVGGYFVYRLVETPRYNGSQQKLRQSAWHAVKQLAGNVEARWLVTLGAVLGTATYLAFWLSAPYYTDIGISAGLFSVILAVRSLIKAALAHRFKRQRRLERNMVGYAAMVGLTYGAMATGHWWLAPAVLGHDAVQALHKQPIAAKLNVYMHPEYRATMNSLVSLVQRLLYAVTGPLVGLLVDKAGLTTGFLVTGAVSSAVAFLALARLHHYGTFRERR